MPGRVLLVNPGKEDVGDVVAMLGEALFDLRVETDYRAVDAAIIGFQPDCVIARITPATMRYMQVLRTVFQRLQQNWLGWTSAQGISPQMLWKLGASEAISDPLVHDILVLRVRNLVRHAHVMEDLRLRAYPGGGYGVPAPRLEAMSARSILFATPDPALFENVSDQLMALGVSAGMSQSKIPELEDQLTAGPPVDVLVVDEKLLPVQNRLGGLAQLRTMRALRGTELVILADKIDPYRRALVDLGACDFAAHSTSPQELTLRLALPLRRRQCVEHLSNRISQTLSLAMIDPLTGLHNRRYLTQHLASMIARAREGQDDISVAMLDIDHFKRINDLHGHMAGDRVLQAIAGRIRDCVRNHDLLARIGGEEFALVMPDTPISRAVAIAERIRIDVERTPQEFALPPLDSPLTISIGIAAADLRSTVVEHALKPADQALYAAKRAGRNMVQTALPAA